MKNFKPEALEIRKAGSTDIPEILKLLSELNSEVSVDRWKPFFDFFHSSGENYFGYVLEIDGQLQGFIGTVISDRMYNKSKVTCCNIHGWIVRQNYKQHSLKMMTEVLKQDMVFTCFSAMEITQLILKRLKFFYMDHAFGIYRPTLNLLKDSVSLRIVNNSEEILDEHERSIFTSHQPFTSVFVTITTGEEQCLMVFKPEYYLPGFLKSISFLFPKKFKRLLKLEYIGNRTLFSESFSKCAFRLLFKVQGFGFIICKSDRELAQVEKTKKYFGQRPYMYRYDKEKLGAAIPDTLYSEMFVLNHKG